MSVIRSILLVLIAILIGQLFLFYYPGDTREVIARRSFLKNVDSLRASVVQLQQLTPTAGQQKLKDQFKKCRLAYKRCEALLAFYSPLTEAALNEPAVASVEDPNFPEPESPHGFQVMEEVLFASDDPDRDKLNDETNRMLINIDQFLGFNDVFIFTPAYVIDAQKQQLIRISCLSVAGYDSPIAAYSLNESATALSEMESLIKIYFPARDSLLRKKGEVILRKGVQQLLSARSFNEFDRIAFTKNFAIPLFQWFNEVSRIWKITPFKSNSNFSFNASSFWSADFFSKKDQATGKKDQIALGRKLFFDPIISGNRVRSCAFCHNPSSGLADGLAKPVNMDGKTTGRRNTPTLWNASLQPFQFIDMRAKSLEDQLDSVLNNHAELGSSMDTLLVRLSTSDEYRKLFDRVFDKSEGLNSLNIRKSFAAYLETLVSFSSTFDEFMQGKRKRIAPEVYRGFNLFMGKAKCGTCHFPPLFTGVLPPRFNKMESEIIGVPESGDSVSKLDPDPGRFGHLAIGILKNSFKTTTLKNIALTAPYMHNGVFRTLEEVINFYDKGGGKGIGINVENQTLPSDKLNLKESEKKDLLMFLHSLTDTVSTRKLFN